MAFRTALRSARADVLRILHRQHRCTRDGQIHIPVAAQASEHLGILATHLGIHTPATSWDRRRRHSPNSGDVESSFADIQASAQGRDIWVMGGGDLAGEFADACHLDELWIQFAPVTLGSGTALLPRELQLELLDASRNEDFVCAHYRVLRELGA